MTPQMILGAYRLLLILIEAWALWLTLYYGFYLKKNDERKEGEK